jgi:hypothetical protein
MLDVAMCGFIHFRLKIYSQSSFHPTAAIVDTSDQDRQRIWTIIAKFRTNDLQIFVNWFFFEDSPSKINYSFKQNKIDKNTPPTEENKQNASHNRRNAKRLMTNMLWLNGSAQLQRVRTY